MKNTLFALLIGSLAVGAGAAEAIFFQETSADRVGQDEFGEPTVVTRRSGSFNAAVDYPEFGCVRLLASMPVELHLGGFDFTARIDDVDLITGTSYLYYIRDESLRRIGSLTVRRTFSQLMLNATFSELPEGGPDLRMERAEVDQKRCVTPMSKAAFLAATDRRSPLDLPTVAYRLVRLDRL